MSASSWSQSGYDVRLDWGPTGPGHVGRDAAALVVVDVLSFTTAVTVALELGTEVVPARWRDERAAQLALDHDAAMAVGRREMTRESPWSLSPASLRHGPPPDRLVLPSPNGATIVADAEADGHRVVAASLRNATAVARWLAVEDAAPVAIIAAGERWPDGSLRPALEDLLGAGAVASALVDAAPGLSLSPEAAAARALYDATTDVADAVRRCASGVELREQGFADDVEIALELGSSTVVPLLRDGRFSDVSDAARR